MSQPFYQIMPELDHEEYNYIQNLVKDLDEQQIYNFASMYRARRKDPQIILLTCLLGFFGLAGVHRMLMNQIGMGILYFFTAGLCLIGTIVDLVNHRKLAWEHNIVVVHETISMIKR
ncbi:MAG: TM2 domain-containing protein [Bacteroidales bacterium]|jgi:TM2 domain-containing membrane protein YozV|nr:TM2 domain-containing protein [Bacteroidales bacterium]